MGYFPFGSAFFTNLLHYVRSGDFVNNLLLEARNVNEYAFALGAACHYMADKYGHSIATNRAVPLVYPETGKKFGQVVTYEEDKLSHLRVEFGFDVLQTARGSYLSQSYHNFIGFSMADSLLAQAFEKTYGLRITSIFPRFSLAVGTFRWTVRNLFPALTKAAWISKKKELKKRQPGLKARQFIYHMKRRQYVEEFGREREKPGLAASVLSFVIRILPKIGKLRSLKFRTPGPEAEKLFINSFETVLVHYSTFIENNEQKKLADIDYDTGQPTKAGEYCLCDQTYDAWLLQLQKDDFSMVTSDLKNNVINFYRTAYAKKRIDSCQCTELATALKALGDYQVTAPIVRSGSN